MGSNWVGTRNFFPFQNGQMAPLMIGKPVSGSRGVSGGSGWSGGSPARRRDALMASISSRSGSLSPGVDGVDALDAFTPTLRVCTCTSCSPSSWMDVLTRSARVCETRPMRPTPSSDLACSGNPPLGPGSTPGAGLPMIRPKRPASTKSPFHPCNYVHRYIAGPKKHTNNPARYFAK